MTTVSTTTRYAPAKRFFWQDSFCMLLFMLLFGIMASNFEIGGLAKFLEKIRWGLLGIAALAGLKYVPDGLRQGMTQAHKALLALIILGLASCVYSIMPWYSFQRLMSFVMLWVALFLGAWGWLSRPGNLKLGLGLLYGLLWVTSLIGAYDILTAGGFSADSRAEGAFNRATSAGTFAAVALPIILWKIRYSQGIFRTAAIGLFGIQGYILVFSSARGALVAGTISLFAVVWTNYRRYGPMLTGGLAFIGVMLLAINGLKILPKRIVRSESLGTLTGRTDRWYAGWRVYQKSPLLGYGHGVERFCIGMDRDAVDVFYKLTGGNRRATRMRQALENRLWVEETVHSEYLARLLEEGVLGLVCFLWFWASILWGMVRATTRPNNPLADLVRCLYAAVWVIFVDSFLHSWMFAVGFGLNPVLWYVIALTLAADWQLMRYERRMAGLSHTQKTPASRPLVPAGAGMPL